MELEVMNREAGVRGISEGDEELVAELESFSSPEERTTALLARCVTRLGEMEGPGAAAVRNLPLGAREALLLEVRRLTFGERIECVQNCPACGESLSFEVRVEDLVQLGKERTRARYDETLIVDGTAFRVSFRLPTGADLEVLAATSPGNRDKALEILLSRCIEEVRQDEGPVDPAELPHNLLARLSSRMSELDPLAEIRMPLTCPGCGHVFDTLFDTSDYFLRELEMWRSKLYKEVHRIALAYHWCEDDILRMKPRKRKIYLDLLAREHANE
jgi:hypothetical protein